MSGRVPRRQLRRGRASLAPLDPALTADPPNGLAGTAVDECLRIFLGQAARPCLKSLIGEIRAFRVGVLQRPTKVLATAAVEFVAGGIRGELAAVLLPPVHIVNEFP